MSDPTIPSQDESAYLADIEDGARRHLLDTLDECAEVAAALRAAPAESSEQRALLRLLVGYIVRYTSLDLAESARRYQNMLGERP